VVVEIRDLYRRQEAHRGLDVDIIVLAFWKPDWIVAVDRILSILGLGGWELA
jgi:hypothetical protein